MKNVKYIVRVFILKFDENRNSKSESFEYTFQEPNLMDARNMAIEKTKDLRSLFEDEISEDSRFSSFVEAELKGFKNFKSYSLELVFQLDEEGCDYTIFGEAELTIEALEQEAYYYRDNIENQQYDKVEDEDGEYVEILESNSDFFLNQYQY